MILDTKSMFWCTYYSGNYFLLFSDAYNNDDYYVFNWSRGLCFASTCPHLEDDHVCTLFGVDYYHELSTTNTDITSTIKAFQKIMCNGKMTITTNHFYLNFWGIKNILYDSKAPRRDKSLQLRFLTNFLFTYPVVVK